MRSGAAVGSDRVLYHTSPSEPVGALSTVAPHAEQLNSASTRRLADNGCMVEDRNRQTRVSGHDAKHDAGSAAIKINRGRADAALDEWAGPTAVPGRRDKELTALQLRPRLDDVLPSWHNRYRRQAREHGFRR